MGMASFGAQLLYASIALSVCPLLALYNDYTKLDAPRVGALDLTNA